MMAGKGAFQKRMTTKEIEDQRSIKKRIKGSS